LNASANNKRHIAENCGSIFLAAAPFSFLSGAKAPAAWRYSRSFALFQSKLAIGSRPGKKVRGVFLGVVDQFEVDFT